MAGERNLSVTVDDSVQENPQTDEVEHRLPNSSSIDRGEPEFWDDISIGDQYDVRDTEGYWCEAEVLKIDTSRRRVFVTFLYWDSKWDTWISDGDGKIAILHTHTYVEGKDFQVGQRVEALDETQKWLHAFIIDISEAEDKVKVHYMGWHFKFDAWLGRQSSRIRPYGRNKPVADRKRREQKLWRVPGNPQIYADGDRKSSSKAAQNALKTDDSTMRVTDSNSGNQDLQCTDNNLEDADHCRQISQISDRYTQYIEALSTQPVPLKVVSVPGDGNCLFRSVAHQVYGNYELHNLVRQRCMDYMEADAGFYSQFVEGGMEAFPFYLRAKRLNACWGDDPEIQSICELYNRPAEIWAYDTQRGARKLRTFHEATGRMSTQPPLRLSYYGGGHYDSIIDAKHSDQLLLSVPGEAETLALTRVTERVALASSSSPLEEATRQSDRQATEEAAVDLAVQMSRADNDRYDWQDDLETCLSMSLQELNHRRGSSDLLDGNSTATDNSSTTNGGDHSVENMSKAASGRIATSVEPDAPNAESSLISMQGDILRTVAEESERDFIDKALLSYLTDESQSMDDQFLQQARLESIAEAERAVAQDSLSSHVHMSSYATCASSYGNDVAQTAMMTGSDEDALNGSGELNRILKLSELSEDEALQMALRESVAITAAARPQQPRFFGSSSSSQFRPVILGSMGGSDENDALGEALRNYILSMPSQSLSQGTSSSNNSAAATNHQYESQNQYNEQSRPQNRGNDDDDDEEELQRAIAESLR